MILCLLDRQLNDKNVSSYLMLVNSLASQIEDASILEKVIKKIGDISLQNAYQMKKEVKLKIISKIDHLKGGETQKPEL